MYGLWVIVDIIKLKHYVTIEAPRRKQRGMCSLLRFRQAHEQRGMQIILDYFHGFAKLSKVYIAGSWIGK